MLLQKALTLISGPAMVGGLPLEPVTLYQAKAQIEDIDEDTYHDDFISSLITAARQSAENSTNRAFVTQIRESVMDDWPAEGSFLIPRPPLQSIESIHYRPASGGVTLWSPESYIVDTDSEPGRVSLIYSGVYPNAPLQPIGGVRARFVCGYAAVGTGAISSVGTAVTGAGTAFVSEVSVGDSINIPGQRRMVATVASDTALVLTAAFSEDQAAGTAFRVGGTKHGVPHPIRQAIMLMVGHLYAHREEVLVGQVQAMAAQIPKGATALLAPYKVTWFQ